MKLIEILELMKKYDETSISSYLRIELGLKLDNVTAKMSKREINDLIERYFKKYQNYS